MQRLVMLFAAFLIAGCATAIAQTQPSDPPLIAGRLSVAEGDVQIWRVEEDSDGAWDLAQINDVVTVGTGLYTGASGRAEFRVGPNTFRLSSGSRGGFKQLDYGGAVFNLEHGSLNVSLARPQHGELAAVTVDGVRIDLASPGRYRIDTEGNGGQARLTVFSGYGNVLTSSSPISVASGQALMFGAGSSINFEQASATSFDQWALSRDDRYRNVQSARYVSPYMTGYEELDFHGDWIPDASYGNVWVPRVVPIGWAPYRAGQWRWVQPWGWTWVDQAPWGYAPFHYGRWVTIGNRWCWWPGGHHARPVWAPALVGFVGGANVSVSFGGPVVGWYPLAPWHRYQPHYRHNPQYVTIINQTIINNPPRHGLSRTPPNNQEGTTMVPGPRFRDPVMKVALPVGSSVAALQPMAPPPKNTGMIRKVAEDGMVRRPQQVQQSPQAPAPAAATPGAPALAPSQPAPVAKIPVPTRVMPPMTAQPIPNRGVMAQPPLPGNDPQPLAQPPKFNRAPPTAIQTTPMAPRVESDMARPQSRARMAQELLPQAQQNPRVVPAEPARFPPGAPPTIKQPVAPRPHAAPPVARQAPVPAPQPAQPVAPVAPTAAPSPAPRAEAPRANEQIVREAARPKQMQLQR